jgi:hypothetical protein
VLKEQDYKQANKTSKPTRQASQQDKQANKSIQRTLPVVGSHVQTVTAEILTSGSGHSFAEKLLFLKPLLMSSNK